MVKVSPENRKQLWIALSNFYLDIELQVYHYKYIDSICKEVKCSYEEAKEIDRTEVFPTLYRNLLSVAGVWEAFDEDWLIEQCTTNYRRKKTFIFRLKTNIKLLLAGGHFKENWKSFDQVANTK